MEYRAVGNRCAVILDDLELPISNEETLSILNRKGFEVVKVDIIALARQCIGTSLWQFGAKPSQAPEVLDCSSFVKWLYGMRGVWLPRRSIQQRKAGTVVNRSDFTKGDLVFISSWSDYYFNDPKDGVGHVGIYTGNGTVIHAANKKDNVIESSLHEFVITPDFRGARRYLPKGVEVLTLEIPSNREVETSDDLRWIVLQTLPTLSDVST